MDQIDYLIGELGLHIFPLRPETKQPYAGSWSAQTTNDPTLARMWQQGLATHKSYSKSLQKDVEPDFSGCIWGVNCGKSNICVLDIDEGWHEKQQRHKEGFANFLALKKANGGYVDTFAVQTPSKGFHVITTGKCKSNNSVIAKDVDVKSDGAYIVAPGTVTSKGEYKVIKNLPFAPTPQWLLDKQGPRVDRKEILAVVGQEMTDAERAKLIDALSHIDPDQDHDHFRDIGMGINHSFPGEDGFEVYDAWAKGEYSDAGCPDTYTYESCKSKWLSFGKSDTPGTDITIATVYHHAIEGGWVYTPPSARAAFADAPPVESYAEQVSKAATAGNPIAIAQEQVLDPSSFVRLRTMDEVIIHGKSLPPSKRLFDDLIMEDEITILFSSMGHGKTALGMQIAASIALGKPIAGFAFEGAPSKVVYCDFELSDKQVARRYDTPDFGPNLIRMDIDPDANIPVNVNHSNLMLAAVEEAIKRTGARVCVVDNITYMGDDLSEVSESLTLMKKLKDLKKKYELTMIIDAHTPKIEPFKHISMNNLSGSSNLGNFIDACFAIGLVKGLENMRYLVQLKARNDEKKYSAGNVILCELGKLDGRLAFQHRGTRPEADLIKGTLDPDNENSVPAMRRDFVRSVVAGLLKLDDVVTIRSLAKGVAEKSWGNTSTRALFHPDDTGKAADKAYKSMMDMLSGDKSVWFDVGDRCQVELFRDPSRMTHIKNGRSEFGVRMVKDA